MTTKTQRLLGTGAFIVSSSMFALSAHGQNPEPSPPTISGSVSVDGTTPPTGKFPTPDFSGFVSKGTHYILGGAISLQYEDPVLGNLLGTTGSSFTGNGVTSDQEQTFDALARVPGLKTDLAGNPVGYWLNSPYFVGEGKSTCGEAVCVPDLTLKLYAKYGNVAGRVRMVNGADIPHLAVIRATAKPPFPPFSGDAYAPTLAVTDEHGVFDFSIGRMLVPSDPIHECSPLFCESIPIPIENEWALRVTGDGGIDGTKSKLFYSQKKGEHQWEISVEGTNKSAPNVFVTSSTTSFVDFFLPLGQVFKKPGEVPEIRPEQCTKSSGITGGIGTMPLTGGDDTCQGEGGTGGPCPAAQNPVSLITGSVYLDQTDIQLPGMHYPLLFPRSYNSSSLPENQGTLGRGWTHAFEQRIEVISSQILRLWSANGAPRYFSDPDGDQVFTPFGSINPSSSISPSASGFTRTYRNGWREEYDTAGRLVRVVDRLNRATELARDGLGRLTQITSPEGRWLKLEHGFQQAGFWHLTRLVGPEGTVAEYSYSLVANTALMLSQVRYIDGTGYRFTYDNDFRLLTVSDLAGVVLHRHGYGPDGRAAWSERDGGRDRHSYTYEDGRTLVTNARGGVAIFEFQEKTSGVVVSRVTGCTMCGSAVGTRTYEYDDEGRVTRSVDADNNETVYTYSGADLVAVKNALNRTTTFGGHDAFGQPGTVSVPGFGTTTTTWAPEGLAALTPPTGPTTSLSYSNGRLSTLSSGGLTYSLDISEAGELLSFTDPRGNTTSYTHDLLGRIKAIRRPDQTTTTLQYGARGRLLSVTRPDGRKRTFTYDGSGRLQSETDEAGRTSRYSYDRYGNLEAALDPLGGVTRFAYDAMLNVTSVTDAKAQKTNYEHDEWARLLRMIDPMNGQEEYSYSPGGRLLTRHDRRGITTTLSHDAAGRLTGKTYSNGDPSVTVSYDDDNRQITLSNGTDTVMLSFDAAARLISETSAFNGTNVSYTYNSDGLLDALSLDGTSVASYTYLSGVLSSVDFGSHSFQFVHDSLLRRQRLTYPNGIQTDYSFDILSRLTAIDGGSAFSVSYTHDVVGNRVSKSVGGLAESYGYDALDRLTSVARPAGVQGSQALGYDRVGNRTTDQRDGLGSVYAFDSRNRLTASQAGPMLIAGSTDEPAGITVQGQSARMLPGNAFEAQVPGASTFTVQATDASGNTRTTTYGVSQTQGSAILAFDEAGNLVSKTEGAVTTAYEWNAENQLLRVTRSENGGAAAELARFLYDPLGRRVEKVAGGVTHSYAYDGQDVLRETVSDGSTTATYRYIHGPGIDEPLAKEDVATGALTYFHADGLGSIVKMTDQAGAVTSSISYDAWGNVESGTPSPYGFTGREWDPEIALYYYRARYYDPKLGRFISEDPIGFAGGFNFFAYVENNPVTLTDPFGLQAPAATMREKVEAVMLVGIDRALAAKRIADEVYNDPAITGFGGRQGGKQDAIRHCLWTCRTAREIDPFTASAVADVHEQANKRAGQSAADTAMDAINTQQGLACAARPGGSSCLQECIASYAAGNLKTVRP